MKTLYESLLDDFEDLSAPLSQKVIKEKIKQFLKDNYKNPSKFKISRKPNDDGLYEVTCTGKQIQICASAMALTNGLFKFADFDGSFHCNLNSNLTSLEGAPKELGENFDCRDCNNLTSLEGAPEKVRGYFLCSNCHSLTSLKGAPKEVGADFACHNCSSLTSLEGAPEYVYGSFSCYNCGKQFTDAEVLKYTKVKRADRIYNK